MKADMLNEPEQIDNVRKSLRNISIKDPEIYFIDMKFFETD